MTDDLKDRVERIRKMQALLVCDEQTTKQGAVLPLLARLGWDRDNIAEVKPEYSVATRRVDFCLLRNDLPVVFVEVKRAGEDLQRHQEQLLDYAFREGVKIAALTDGIIWWLYLPTQTGSWEQRRFFTIDIARQESTEVAGHLRRFLEKEAVMSGAALKAAEELHAGHTKEKRIRETIPKAWREICEGPDEEFLEILAERVERLCGHRADYAALAEYVAKVTVVASMPTPRERAVDKTESPRPPIANAHDDAVWTFRKPAGFRFLTRTRTVTRFKDILVGVSEMLLEQRGEEFWQRVKDFRSSRGRAYFSREYLQMQNPAEIANSGIYVETCFSANETRTKCHDLLEIFGHSAADLHVDLKPS